MSGNVNHPKHYNGNTSLECIEVMKIAMGAEAVYHFCLCNAFKYMWRYKDKNGAEDIAKARWYLNYILEEYKDVPISQELMEMHERLDDLCIKITNKLDLPK